MKCIYCTGILPKNFPKGKFHYICRSRVRRNLPTPKIELEKPMTDKEIRAELSKDGLALDQIKIIG